MMSDLLIKVMNMPRAAQRMLALGLLVVVVGTAAFTTLQAVDALFSKRAEIIEARWTLGKIETLLQQRPPKETPEASDKSEGASTAFLPGNTVPLIQANLQGRLNSIAGAQNASVISVGNVPPVSIDNVEYVGVRADLQGGLEALHNTIFQLEMSSPSLIIREAIIRSTGNPGMGNRDAPVELVAQITVYGAVDRAVAAAVTKAASQ